jgi:diguanylate cyclase (GGDEF)-like protein
MDAALAMPVSALERLMPLHLILDGEGRITGYGPTLAKLVAGKGLLGQSLFGAFEIRRPAGIVDMDGLRALEGEKLSLSLLGAARPLLLRGLAMVAGDGRSMVVNLSFGIGVIDAVRANDLTDGDFAPTDLAVEMMYLVEAKEAAMTALRGFARRLEGDKQLAEAQALTDTLTGLRNRRALDQALDGLIRDEAPFGLMHLDLDFFKAVNDTLGHAAGDHVLRRVAVVLEREIRVTDTVARVGGDEFVLIFPAIVEARQMEAVARRIIEQLTQPIDFEGKPCRISASIGITLSNHYDRPDRDRMQNDADEALYGSKRAGRGRATVHRAIGTDRRIG